MNCPKCNGLVNETKGSPVSRSINIYECTKCGWRKLRCGNINCDGYLEAQNMGYPHTVRYNCVKCGWTGTGAPFH